MKTQLRQTGIRPLILAIVAGGCLLGARDATAQASVTPQITSNGGDVRDLGGGGEMFSTIGEPIAVDSISTVDDKVTWTGFWQITPIGPIASVHDAPDGGTTAFAAITGAAPDPFTSELELRVNLARPGRVELVVFDVVGRQVGTLVDRDEEAGTLRLRWRPEGIDAGSYVIQLLVDGAPTSARLVHYAK